LSISGADIKLALYISQFSLTIRRTHNPQISGDRFGPNKAPCGRRPAGRRRLGGIAGAGRRKASQPGAAAWGLPAGRDYKHSSRQSPPSRTDILALLGLRTRRSCSIWKQQRQQSDGWSWTVGRLRITGPVAVHRDREQKDEKGAADAAYSVGDGCRSHGSHPAVYTARAVCIVRFNVPLC